MNELSFADTADKTDLLNKLKECLIYRVPFMIEECLDNIMMCSLDKSSDVRKLVVIIIEDIWYALFFSNYRIAYFNIKLKFKYF